MLTSNSLLLSSTTQQQQQNQDYYPPSPPLSTSVSFLRSPHMSKTSLLANSWCPPSSNSKSSSNTTATESSSFLNLEKVVQTYGSQPELLELILSSKVEEDRRRAEEAKLRRKEIDYMLQKQQQQQQQCQQSQPQQKKYQHHHHCEKSSFSNNLPPISSTANNSHHNQRVNSLSSATSVGSVESTLPRLHHHTKLSYQYDSTPSSTWRNNNSTGTPQYLNRPSSSPKRRSSSSIEMLLIPSPNSLELKLPELSLTPSSSSSIIKNISLLNYLNADNKRSRSSSFLVNDESEDDSNEEQGNFANTTKSATAAGSAPPSPPIDSFKSKPNNSSNVHKRRRREMQAITTIIETREFPYNDDYLWKNNGNTVHKKTGFRSIYYKCSNSSKGCPVNKTVTFKDNGEHLIKYRGQHLTECNRIKRITDL